MIWIKIMKWFSLLKKKEKSKGDNNLLGFFLAMEYFKHFTNSLNLLNGISLVYESFFENIETDIKGCRMGRSDKVSLWYVSLLFNTRFRFFILE